MNIIGHVTVITGTDLYGTLGMEVWNDSNAARRRADEWTVGGWTNVHVAIRPIYSEGE